MKTSELQKQLARAEANIRALQEELAESNRGLIALDMELEERVQQRTAELARANNALRAEIAERQRAEEVLAQSEERYHALFDTLIEGFCTIEMVFDGDGKPVDYRFLEINPAFEKQTGLHNAQGRLMRDLAPGHETHWFEIYGKIALTGEPARFENEAKALGRHYEVSAYRIGEPESRRVAILFNDITERKRMEEVLRESEERFRTMAELIPQLAWMARPDGHIFWYNQRWYEYTGTTLKQMEGWGWQSVHDPIELPRVLEKWKAAIASGKPWEDTFRLRRYDGAMRWHLSRALPICNEQGHVMKWLGTNTDISERMEMERALQQAKEAAEAANVAKSQFLANVSHELRTPMNAIMGMTDLALGEDLPPNIRDYLQTARQSADGLLELLDDILDLSRIEAGSFQLESTPFDLHQTVQHVIKTLGVRAYEKGLELVCNLGAVPSALIGDPLRLRQVLVNLVGNAIKFTPKGKVVVSATVQSEGADEVILEFAVSDTGIGIPQEAQERIFAPFTQADSSTTRHYGGTGLGLAISQRIVSLMGGRIRAESQAGRGSTFRFTARFGVQEKSEGEPGLPPVTQETLRGLPVQQAIMSSDPAEQALSAPPFRLLRVLVAEDTPASQKLVTYVLGKRGHSVEIAQNGKHALDAISQRDFDVVLMDVQMPLMDGFQATRQIRKLVNPKKAGLPVIAMTAHALKGDAERCLSAGMNGYISKPVKGEELIELVERFAEHVPDAAPIRQPAETVSSSTAAPVEVFNLDDAVRQCFGQYDMFREMVACLFSEADPLLDRIRTALADGNALEMGDTAHRLKGTVGYLGAGPALDAIRRVEQICKAGELWGAAEAIRHLGEQVEILKNALSPHRKC